MFTRLHQILQRFRSDLGGRLNSNGGQVVLIMIVILAIAIILYAVLMNLGRISQNKTQLTVAANTSASLMGSSMAGYAESLFRTSLGGEKGTGNDLSVCGITGVLAILVWVIGIIIYIVVVIIMPALAVTGKMIFAAVAAIVALAVQIAVIQPGITSLWNKMMAGLEPQDQFVERGIQLALQTVVSDSELVNDEYDIDLDGFFGAEDRVNRFGVYYSERLKQQDSKDTQAIRDFLRALEKFIFGYTKSDPTFDPETMPRDWSLWDPVCDIYTDHPCCQDPASGAVIPSYCNPCCVPEFLDGGGLTGIPPGEQIRIRPECCDAGPKDFCGTASTCEQASLYPNGDGTSDYPFIFNQFMEDHTNNCLDMGLNDDGTPSLVDENGNPRGCLGRPAEKMFRRHISFLELIGRDDEHPLFELNSGSVAARYWQPQHPNLSGFQASDVWTFPVYYESPLATNESAEGVVPNSFYSLLWALSEIPMNLGLVDLSNPISAVGCYWCDARVTEPDSEGNTCDDTSSCDHNNPWSFCCACSAESAGLNLPIDCRENEDWPEEAPCSYCVDANTDNVSDDPLSSFLLDSDECGIGPDPGSGIWKQGADRFCSAEWPYESACVKHGTLCTDEAGELRECVCGEAGASPPGSWPDDYLDQMVYEMHDFINAGVELLKLGEAGAVRNFHAWFESALEWIRKPTFADPREGKIIEWRKAINNFDLTLSSWLNQEYESSGCDQSDPEYVWCPGPANCPGVDPAETGNSMDAVLKCLAFGVYDLGAHEDIVGNSGKFNACGNNALDLDNPENPDPASCWGVGCNDIPRSLLGNSFYDALFVQDPATGEWSFVFDQPVPVDYAAYEKCLISINDDTCNTDPSLCNSLNDYVDPQDPAKDVDIPDFVEGPDNRLVRCAANCQAGPACDWAGREIGIPFNPPTQEYTDAVTCLNNGCGLLYCPSTSPGGHPLDCSSGSPYLQELSDILTDPVYGGSCADQTFQNALQAEMAGSSSCEDDVFIDAVTLARDNAGGSCIDDTFIGFMKDSAMAAGNQVAKFLHRYRYLADQNRRIEVLESHFRAAVGSFLEFERTFNPLIFGGTDTSEENAPIPHHVIYGWQSEPPTGEPDHKGDWHLVRVDTRVPGRCEGNCGRNGNLESGLPTIKTYTRHWGTKRCYSLGDYFGNEGCNKKSHYKNTDRCFRGGVVKARVIRYDGPKEDQLFPNNLLIRKPTFKHPEGLDFDDLNGWMSTICEGSGIGDREGPRGAFMVNGPDTEWCWDIANAFLEQGIVSESCVEYFYHNPSFANSSNRRGFSLKFVDCPPGPF